MKERFSDIINRGIESYLENIYTCLPGKIESYDITKKKANVKPLVKKRIGNSTFSYPVVNEVPVIFPSTFSAIIHLPVKKGDGCLILFSKESLENYLKSALNEVEPGDKRKFSLSDAFCLPGLFPFGSPGKTTTKTNDITIQNDSGNITLNGDTKSFVTHTELDAALQSFITALNITLGTKLDGAGVPGTLSINISTAKTNTVKTGG